MDLPASLAETLRATQRVVEGVRPDQLDQPTPCSEWDVRALIGHMVWVNAAFAAGLRGDDPVPRDEGDRLLGDDPAGAYRRTTTEALEEWASPGALERTLHLAVGDLPASLAARIHFIDNLVHCWDLATVTGQDHGLDPERAGLALQMCQENFAAMGDDKLRGPGKGFAAEVPWPAEAPVHEHLVAFLGRHPHGPSSARLE
ncbi:MAG: TIGR03086 family metal-binding protein [Egibacteraceae bacterium]